MELLVFENNEFGSVRTISINGEPFFVGKDIAGILGYSNGRKALIDHVDSDDKEVTKCDTLGGAQQLTVINESGLYSLILSSKLPNAKRFKHWVTSEVLPSIRKNGLYAIDEILDNPDLAIKALQQLKEEREKNRLLKAQTEADKPKVLFADAVTASDTTILIGELAKLLKQNGVDMGQNRLFEWLRSNSYLISRNGSDYNMPTQKAMDLGLFKIKETAIVHTDGHITTNKTSKVTGKGQAYFVNLFLKGQLPCKNA